MILNRFLISILFSFTFFALHAQTVRYVRVGASGEGRSWTNASGSIQAMIDASQPGDMVYVAAGTYYAHDGKPLKDERGEGVLEREKAFVMKAGVKVIGGFSAAPAIAAIQTPETRNKKSNGKFGWQLADVSILSGESKNSRLKDNWYWNNAVGVWTPGGYAGDNAVHVVWFATNGFGHLVTNEATPAIGLSEEALLDGFTIQGGSADGVNSEGIQGHSARFGGGVYLVGNGVLQNCVIRENYALTRGGGIFCNNGGKISDCLIERNASPGSSLSRNGFGGGIYCLSAGKIERCFVINNSARMGGGIYFAKDVSSQSDQMVAEMSVVANNTAMHDAGGVYCDRAGVLTGVIIAKNNTLSLQQMGNGNTGGIYCNEFGVLTSCVLWENFASAATCQFYGNNVRAADQNNKIPASVQLTHCAVNDLATEYWGNAQITNMQDLTAKKAAFKKDPGVVGVIPTGDYFSIADWDKKENSFLYRRGAVMVETPIIGVDRVNLPVTAIDGTPITARPDIGAYFFKGMTVNPVYVAGKWIVYVDNQSEEVGDGSSWTKPLPLLVLGIRRLEELGGGEVWVKEGIYIPVSADNTTDPRMFSLTMGNKVNVYGGFPHAVREPRKEQRNPVLYRTTLNADIGVKGNNSDNAARLVSFGTNITDGAILDGLHLVNGNAQNDPWNKEGGGIRVEGVGAVIRNCMIENCIAFDGAGIWAINPVVVENCVINNNKVTAGLGAAVVKLKEGSRVTNVTVVNNDGVGVSLPSGELKNSVIWGNSGDITLPDIQMTGIPFVSYCAVQELDWGISRGNIVLPKGQIHENSLHFTNPTTQIGIVPVGYATLLGGAAVFELGCLSELINRGQNADAPASDIAGVSRLRGGRIDIGAYEATCMPANDVRYVRQGASGDGLSWETASGNLQTMVNTPGVKEVWVAAGTYKGCFVMREGVNVFGGFPANGNPSMQERQPASQSSVYRTVLDAQETGRVLHQQADFNTLTLWDGFTITNGKVSIDNGEDGGAGVKMFKNGKLRNCVITKNQNIVDQDVRPWIPKTPFVRGGGVHCRGGILENCYISDNLVQGVDDRGENGVYGGGIYMTAGSIFNCVISGNKCIGKYADGCAAFVENASFYNNTIVNNTAESIGQGRTSVVRVGFMEGSGLSLVNCIIYGNTAEHILFSDQEGGIKVVTYSLIQGGFQGEGNISGDPMFVNMANNDYRLREGSPCINSGNTQPKGITLPETDMDYSDRVKDCAVDMGAYELGREVEVIPGDTDGKRVAYVTLYGAGNAQGDSWANAACASKLQKAIDRVAALGGGEVWVGTGLGVDVADFYPIRQIGGDVRNYSVFIPAKVRLLGGFKGNEKNEDERIGEGTYTRLNGDIQHTESYYDDAYHVAVVESGGMLEGFHIINGNANHLKESEYQRGGGVVVMPEGSLRNCRVEHCLASGNGAGVYLAGKDASLTGSVITNNEAEDEGGGVYAEQYANLAGNTIVENIAAQGGGFGFHFPVRMISCVIWGNMAGLNKNLSGNIENTYEIVTGGGIKKLFPINYSAIEGREVPGIKNIRLSSRNSTGEQSPEFISPKTGNWDLTIASSLIDAGLSNDIATEFPTEEDFCQGLGLSRRDMAGRKRIRRADTLSSTLRMDIGAYEVDYVITPPPGAERLYVCRTAKGTGDGTSWENAMGDLHVALDYFAKRSNMEKRAEIWIQGGYTYTPIHMNQENQDINNVSFILSNNLSIYGGFRGNTEDFAGEKTLDERERYDRNQNGIIEDFEFKYSTVLDGAIGSDRQAYHVVVYDPSASAMEDRGTLLDGLIIQRGKAVGVGKEGKGAGVYTTGKLQIKNCLVHDNYSNEEGAAVYAENEVTILNSSFAANASLNKGGTICMNGGMMANSLLYNNDGGAIKAKNARLLNVTAVRNKDGAIRLDGGEAVNMLLWGNEGETLTIQNGATVTYSALEGEFAGEGNISLNVENNHVDGPLFIQPTTVSGVAGYDWMADWTVNSLSPVVDAGQNAAYGKELPRTIHSLKFKDNPDITEIERISNERIDVGAYEYAQVRLKENACRLYVKIHENLDELSDGSSWEKATADLQGAIEAMERSNCSGVKEIWVAQGVYVPRKYRSEDPRSRSFHITTGGIQIYGGFPDDGTGINPGMSERDPLKYPTVLDGSTTESYMVARVESSTLEVVIDGFVIRGGKTEPKYYPENFGAGMYVNNPNAIINACVFTENITDTYGALGLFGGMARNCLFVNNQGVGVCVLSGGVLESSTIVNNTYGFCSGGEGAVISNSILWGNTKGSIKHWRKASLYTCGIEGDIPSEYIQKGNIRLSSDNMAQDGPRFEHPQSDRLQSFELNCGSPLIDYGEAEKNISTDLAGKPRVLGKGIDIGALESKRGAIPVPPNYTGPTTTCGGNELILKVNNTVQNTEVYWMLEGIDVDFKWNAGQITVGDEVNPGSYVYRAVRVDTVTECRSKEDSVTVVVAGVAVPEKLSVLGNDTVCQGNPFTFTFQAGEGTLEVYEDNRILDAGAYTIADNQVVIKSASPGEHIYRLCLRQNLPGFGECVSRKSDSVKSVVRALPKLIGSLTETIDAGNLFVYVPASDMEGVSFEWSRDNGTVTGRDTINEVLNQAGEYVYTYTLSAGGCRAEYNVRLTVRSVKMTVIEQSECNETVTLSINLPGTGDKTTRYYEVEYLSGATFRFQNRGPGFTKILNQQITTPQQITVKAYSNKNYNSNSLVATTNLWVWGGVLSPSAVSTASSVCFGDDVVLTVSGTSGNDFLIEDNNRELSSGAYTVADNQITIKMPPAGTHSYKVYGRFQRPDGVVCINTDYADCQVVVRSAGSITTEGNMIVKTGEQTDITLKNGSVLAECTWEVKEKGEKIQIATGEMRGNTIRMILLNTDTKRDSIVFWVTCPIAGSCPIRQSVTIWVEPAYAPVEFIPEGTWPDLICAGDDISLVYRLSRIVKVTAAGLPVGLTMTQIGDKITIHGKATDTVTFTLVPEDGTPKVETLSVKPSPEFEIGI